MSESLTFVWLDLEMTGLDVERCAIVEIGVVITKADLVPVAELGRVIWQPDEELEAHGGVRARHAHLR